MDPDLEAAELAAMLVQWAGLPGAQVHRVADLRVLRAPGQPWFTQVHGVVRIGPELDEALAVAPTALVNVVHAVADAAELRRRGLVPVTRLMRMVAPARLVPTPTSPAVRVIGAEAADDVAAVADAGFRTDQPAWWRAPLGRPGWTQVMAYDDGVPVATGGLHVRGSVGWIGATTTLATARGRGAHAALLAARLRLATAQRADRVSVKVEPGSVSHRNLLRAGFVDAYRLTQWASGELGGTEPPDESVDRPVQPPRRGL